MALTKKEKRAFIRELMGAMQKSLLAEVERMPPEWDGVELRQLIADRANAANYLSHHLRGQTLRGKAYKREKIERRL